MNSDSVSNKRLLVKNTALLYGRTLLLMIISLYTSRVILDALGVEDFGVHNVVGGFVGMFAIISNSLILSISRFLTYELGRGDIERLKIMFSTSLTIQIVLAIAIIILAEIIGIWYLNYRINIPDGRIVAAHWALQCSILVFAINLVSVPYNAIIVAHERMDAFAYISILEGLVRLFIAYLLVISPVDKLILYSILLLGTSILIRAIYVVFCKRKFEECYYHFSFDKSLFKEMFNFAGLNFVSNASWILNNQGVNLVVNAFFGVTINAARGVASQVENAIVNFVRNFMTAINPQITKAYASGDRAYFYDLIAKGAKYVFFMFMVFALPFVLETDFILSLWLKEVPPLTSTFVQLSFITSLFDSFGNTGYYACVASGNMKRYVAIMAPLGCSVFPLAWIAYALGAPPQASYIIFGLMTITSLFVRLFVMKKIIDYNPSDFIRQAFFPSILTCAVAAILPLILINVLDQGIYRFLMVLVVSEISLFLSIYVIGLERGERKQIVSYIKKSR